MTHFSLFSATIAGCRPDDFHDEACSNPNLVISQRSDSKVRTYYAPFDHVNREAKLILVGITPGREQMNRALRAACTALRAGRSEAEALALAKREASFKGEMQGTLIRMLDHYGFNRRFGLATTKALWNEDNDVAHFTSALRNPVFTLDAEEEDNYTGGMPSLATYRGFSEVLGELQQELVSVENAFIVPLGNKVATVMERLVKAGKLPLSRILNYNGKVAELPHPSGANRESQNLVLAKELLPVEDYARTKLEAHREEKRKEGKRLSPKQESIYLSRRRGYWERALHNRTALERIAA